MLSQAPTSKCQHGAVQAFEQQLWAQCKGSTFQRSSCAQLCGAVGPIGAGPGTVGHDESARDAGTGEDP